MQTRPWCIPVCHYVPRQNDANNNYSNHSITYITISITTTRYTITITVTTTTTPSITRLITTISWVLIEENLT